MAILPLPVRVESLDAISKLSFVKLGMAPRDRHPVLSHQQSRYHSPKGGCKGLHKDAPSMAEQWLRCATWIPFFGSFGIFDFPRVKWAVLEHLGNLRD